MYFHHRHHNYYYLKCDHYSELLQKHCRGTLHSESDKHLSYVDIKMKYRDRIAELNLYKHVFISRSA